MERHWLILFILVSIRLALAEPDVSTEGSPLVPSESDLPKTTEKDDEASSSESVPASESPADKRPSIYLFKSPSSIKTVQRGKIPEVSSEYALPWSAVETTQEISTNFPGATQESTTVSVSWFGHQKQQEQQRTQQEQQRIQQEQQRMQQEQLRIQQQQQEQQRLQLLQAQQEQQRIQLKQQELQRIQLQQQREQQRIQQQEQQRIQQQEQQRIQQQQQEQQRVQIQQQEQQRVQVQQQEQQRVQVQQQEQQQVQVQQQEQQRVQVQQQEQERVQIQPQQQQQQQEETPQYQPQEQEQQHVHLRPQQEQQQVQLQQQQQVQLQQQQEQQRVQIQEQERLRVPQQNEQQVQLQQQQQQQQHQEQQIQYQPQEQELDRQQQIQQQIQQQQRIQQQHQIQQQERLQHQQQIQKQQQTYEQQRLQQQQQQIQQQVQQQQRQSSTSGFSNIKQFKSSSVKTAQVQENVKNTESDNEVEAKGKVPFQSQPNEAERLQKADQALDQFFSDVLANLSVKMKTGMDEPLGEILDPVRLDDMQLQPLVAGEVFDVKMKKITVSGLSEYRVTQLESQLSDSRIKIGIHYPKLSANCLFGANGTMYEIFKVTGKGNATIIFNEVHARTVLYLTKENGVLQVTSADQPYVDFSSAEILFRDEDAAEDVEPVKAESVATQLGPLYFWVLTANAVDKIDYPLAEYFNKALKEFPLSDFLEGHVFRQRHMRIHVPHNPLPYAYVASELP